MFVVERDAPFDVNQIDEEGKCKVDCLGCEAPNGEILIMPAEFIVRIAVQKDQPGPVNREKNLRGRATD